MDLRKKILGIRDSMAASEVSLLSERVIENLRGLAEYRSCRLPLFYHSFRNEVATTTELLRRTDMGLEVALPRTKVQDRLLECFLVRSLDQLKPGAFSIMEPDPALCTRLDPSLIDLVIVPGIVFDRTGGRFGYGGGFYDRFLSRHAPGAVRVALAFSFQVMDNEIPVQPHDQFMDYIITENEIIHCYDPKDRTQGRKP